ncbi:MAG: mechanosensitive ion channel family protein [Anaerolineae bacterium]|nr:mechanosensitive ion channel family protein [Anaerolineae bacterium]MDW8098783.1 mechanosensitive ion channel family protein [Anaerolineae bacterium]
MLTLPLSGTGAQLASVVLRLGLIGLLAFLAWRGVQWAACQAVRRLEGPGTTAEQLDRLKTLVYVGRSVGYALILLIAGLMALQSLGINIAPLLAGAGVAGLALSLGAQTLIRDFIGGILILAENQFTIGDTIQVGTVTGSVERITLRATYLRDAEGRLYVVPNGDIRLVSNLTVGWARAVVDLSVDYRVDMDQVLHTLESAAQTVQEDPTIQASLLEAPQVVAWVGLKDRAVQVQLMAKTRPGQQWTVAMALRKYAVEALRAAGIEMA